jgi:hypothetical protein
MKTSHSDGRRTGRRIAILALAGMLGSTACATDSIAPESRAVAPGSPHYTILQNEDLVPSWDYSNSNLYFEAFGGSGSLWSTVDEAIPNDDTDYMYRFRTGLPPSNHQAELSLTPPTGTPSPSQSHTLRVRWKVVGDYSNNTPQPTMLTISLIDVANGVIMNQISIPTGNNYIDVTLAGNGASITDYNQLRVRLNLWLKPSTAFNQIQARITSVRLEIR